jgi:beta-N-acetylhexosaminidase
MSARALIVGCAGPRLNAAEREFLAHARPWGLILFKRNIETPAQVSALIQEFRGVVGYREAPVLIDQEGGRVERLSPPQWPHFPPAAHFGAAYVRNPAAGLAAAKLGARLIACELSALGITIDCMPVADLRLPGAHNVIGDRAYGMEIETVARLARAAAEGLLAGGVLPVVKHIPGHGRACADSHAALPVVETARAELERTDFEPFRRLNDLPIAMTAHVLYAAIDASRPATVSYAVVRDVIRDHIGFDGLLLTDDISMNALSGGVRARAEAALSAGCDIVLHCNGRLEEMAEIAPACPPLSGDAQRRAEAALKLRNLPVESMDVAEARARFSAMVAA